MAVERRFPAMGSDAHVVVVGDRGLLDLAQRRLADLERRWSRFLPDSEVSRLNRARGASLQVSAETLLLVQRALAAWQRTGGRFDPTVLGDLVRAGYDRPFEAVVARPGSGVSLLRRGAGRIVVDAAQRKVALPADVGFDPGGIGKGLAADLVVAELLQAGADGACVNVGGDLRVAGPSPDDGPWGVDVEAPAGSGLVARLALVAGGVATSTTARRSWTVAGDLRHHLIDPRLGVPARTAAVAATAVAGEAADAEVAAKAVLLDAVAVSAADPGAAAEVLTAPGGGHGHMAGLADGFERLGCAGIVVLADGAVLTSRSLGPFLVPHPLPAEVRP